jgi:hypothetical protein
VCVFISFELRTSREGRKGEGRGRTASIDQSSIRISSLAMAQTASRIMSVLGETRRTTSEMAFGSERTPVAVSSLRQCSAVETGEGVGVQVSTWVIVMSLYWSFFNASSIASREGRPPTGAPSWVTEAP